MEAWKEMSRPVLAIAVSLLAVSCAGVRPVQLGPPTGVPLDLAWGYGVEKVHGEPNVARRAAHLKALDDLLTRGPLLVSKVVRDSTRVRDARSAERTLESTFRLRASSIIQPSFIRQVFEDGFSWVLVGATPSDIERGWEEFLVWRDDRIAEAIHLFELAEGPQRIGFLEASFTILEEAGAEYDSGLNFYRVKTALDAERRRIAELDAMRANVVRFLSAGKLSAADQTLNRALLSGLTPAEYESLKYRIEDQRARAASFVRAGDALYNDGKYKESLQRYGEAARLDVNHPALTAKTAMAESAHRSARSATTLRTLGIISSTVGHVLSEYFESKREQSRSDREDQEDKEEEQAEQDRDEPRLRRKHESRRENDPEEEDEDKEQTGPDAEDDEEENEDDEEEDKEKPEPVQPILIRIPATKAKPPRGPLAP